jgi:cytochrome c-type biogenesis protein CcmH
MILFWTLGALLAALALAVAARPFWRRRAAAGVSRRALNAAVYRDQLRELDADLAAGTLAQADYERTRQEIERRALEDISQEPAARAAGGNRLVAYGALTVPLLALGIYFAVGNPGALVPQEADGATQQQIEAMVAQLAARLKEKPEDAAGWKMLGRSYTVMGRFTEAAEAYAQAAARAPRDAQLLADFADALAMARGRSLAGDPEKLLVRALEIDPSNLKALALAGTAAFDRNDFARAAALWQRMLPLVPADSEDARIIRENVAEAQARAGPGPAPKARAAEKAAAAARLAGTVTLSPGLKGRAAPDDTVFIFARASEGPPMPLAVLRKRVRDLPVSFALDDSMAMAPSLRLSAFPRVVVGARISKSGNAVPQAGDLQGSSGVVANDAGGVKVTIDGVVGEKNR